MAGARRGRAEAIEAAASGLRQVPVVCLVRSARTPALGLSLALTSNQIQVVFKLESPALIDDSLRCPPALRQLLTRCYSRDQTLRPSSAQVLEGLKLIQADLGTGICV